VHVTLFFCAKACDLPGVARQNADWVQIKILNFGRKSQKSCKNMNQTKKGLPARKLSSHARRERSSFKALEGRGEAKRLLEQGATQSKVRMECPVASVQLPWLTPCFLVPSKRNTGTPPHPPTPLQWVCHSAGAPRQRVNCCSRPSADDLERLLMHMLSRARG
jgi:hypothetical protein